MTRVRIIDKHLFSLLRMILLAMAVMMAVGVYGQEIKVKKLEGKLNGMSSRDLLIMGNVYKRTNKLDSAMLCFFELMNRYELSNGKLKGEDLVNSVGAILNIGQTYLYQFYDYEKAYAYLLRAKEIAEKKHLKNVLCYIYLSLANLNHMRNSVMQMDYDSKQDIPAYKEAYHLAVQNNEWGPAVTIFTNMLSVAIDTNGLRLVKDEIINFSQYQIPDTIEALPFCRDYRQVALAFLKGDYEKALAYLDNCTRHLITLSDLRNRSNHKCIVYYTRFFLLKTMNRDEEAVRELEAYRDMAESEKNQEGLIDAYRLLLLYYREKGLTEKAEHYELLYFRSKDSLVNQGKLENVDRVGFMMDLHKKSEEVKELVHQRKIHHIIITSVAIIALIILSVLLMISYNYKKTQMKNRLLYKKNLELLAIEEERKSKNEQIQKEKEHENAQRNTIHKKYRSSPMDEEVKDGLLQRLFDVMESDKSVYEDGFTIDKLAALAETNANYVSQVINEKKGCNFNAFLNEYRIKEACRRMHNQKEYGQLTIEGIGQSVGFKSRANFASVFKTFTGLTPSAYLKMAREKDCKNKEKATIKNDTE